MIDLQEPRDLSGKASEPSLPDPARGKIVTSGLSVYVPSRSGPFVVRLPPTQTLFWTDVLSFLWTDKLSFLWTDVLSFCSGLDVLSFCSGLMYCPSSPYGQMHWLPLSLQKNCMNGAVTRVYEPGARSRWRTQNLMDERNLYCPRSCLPD